MACVRSPRSVGYVAAEDEAELAACVGSEATAGEDDGGRADVPAGVGGVHVTARATQRHRAGAGQRRTQPHQGGAAHEAITGHAQEDVGQSLRTDQVRLLTL